MRINKNKKAMKPMYTNHPKGKRRGMTLVEAVTAMAVIALASLILLSCFGASMNMLRRGAHRQWASDAAYAEIQRGRHRDDGSVTLTIDGKSYTVYGGFVTDGVYGQFVPR